MLTTDAETAAETTAEPRTVETHTAEEKDDDDDDDDDKEGNGEKDK